MISLQEKAWFQFTKALLYWTSLVCLVSSSQLSPVWSNTEAIITSIYDGRTPYLIVVGDDEGNSRRAPGIYTSDDLGKWHPLILGDVMTGCASQGILSQLSLSKLNRKYPSFAIINQQLILFQMDPDRQNSDNTIILGKGGINAQDIYGKPVEISPVSRLENISIRQFEATSSGQTVLISIKFQEESIFGNGMTFGIFINKGDSIENQNLRLATRPIILDYRYYTYEQLDLLIYSSDTKKAYSPLLLHFLSNHFVSDSTRLLGNWLKLLTTGIERLNVFDSKFFDTYLLPRIDLTSGQIQIKNPPTIKLSVGNLNFVQNYDVLHGNDFIELPNGLKIEGKLNPVSMDETSKGSKLHLYTDKLNESRYFIAYINSTLTFMNYLKYSKTIDILTLDRNKESIPAEVSFTAKSIKLKDGTSDIYLFVSTKGDESKTTVYIVSELLNGNIFLKRKYEIFDDFVPNSELPARLHWLQNDNLNQCILFDHRTPVQESLIAYKQIFIDTMSLLNVTESSDVVKHYNFLKAISEIELPYSIGKIKKFDATSDEDYLNPSGLFVYGSNQQLARNVIGEVLESEGKSLGASSPQLYSKVVNLQESEFPLRISILPMDSSFHKGSKSFKLVAIISSTASSNQPTYFEPLVFDLNFPRSFSEVDGYQIIQNGKLSSNQFILLVTFLKPGSNSDQKAQELIQTYNFKLEKVSEVGTSQQKFNFTAPYKTWASEERVEMSQLQYRVRLDLEGNIYWILTLDKSLQDPQYSLVNLISGKTYFPNTFGGKSIQFLTDEEMQDYLSSVTNSSEDLPFLRNSNNRLNLISRFDVAKMANVSVSEIDSFGENLSHFPELEKHLESLVDPTKPPRHEILLVSDEMYEKMWKSVLFILSRESVEKSKFHIENRSISFNALDAKNKSQFDLIRSLDAIRKTSINERKSVLITNSEIVRSIGTPFVEGDKINVMLRHPDNPENRDSDVAPHLFYFLATEGKFVDLKEFESDLMPEPKVSMVIVASPSDLDKIKRSQLGILNRYSVLKSFNVNKKFLTGSWKVWPVDSSNSNKKLNEFAQQPILELEKDVFQNLNQTLLDLANLELSPKHKVLLISNELKALVKRMIFSRWLAPLNESDPWQYRNPKLQLYQMNSSSKITQDIIIRNFRAMRGNNKESRTVFFSELGDILKVGRPAGVSENFLISDMGEMKVCSEGEILTKNDATLPHFLYWIATEGKSISLQNFEKRDPSKNKTSILLLGEPSEWENLKRDLTLEARYNLIEEFETFGLEAPSIETRRGLLEQVLEKPEIRRLNYQFDATELGSKNQSSIGFEPIEKLMGYLVNRCQTLAQQFSQESTEAYIKVLSAFKTAVVEDPELRVSKVIDRSYLERLLSRIFSIPLNLNILSPNDPYLQLSHERAALKLQEEGYRGPLELKNAVISTLLAPTRNDPTRAVPGSIVIFGDSSTGKTMLFKTMMKMLGLKEYQYQNPTDEEAGYMIINVGRLTSEKISPGGEIMPIDEALTHISNFLSLPRGFRGHILFDDMHKGGKEVIKSLLKFMQTLFDSERGMIRVERMMNTSSTHRIFEIPVRNIHPWMTLNPTQDQKKIERFSKSKVPTDVDVVVATLSTDDHPIEKSFLMRWGLILNLSRFPLDAKAPALSDSLRSSSRNDFNVKNRLTLVSPLAIKQVVDQFPESNARDFLSAATSQLLQIPNESSEDASIFMVVPAGANFVQKNVDSKKQNFEASGTENGDIKNYIGNTMIGIPVDHRVDGKLHLLSMMVDAVRTLVFESFIDAITQDERFAGGPRQLRGILAPTLHGTLAYFRKKEYMPLQALNLESKYFIESKLQHKEFKSAIENNMSEMDSFFEPWFQERFEKKGGMELFLDRSTSYYQDRNRSHVLVEYSNKLTQLLIDYLNALLRVDSVVELPRSEEWLKSLKESDFQEEFFQLGKALSHLFLEFWTEIFDSRLVENRDPIRYYMLSSYDLSRLYSMIIDRCVSQLPWGNIFQFMLKNLMLTTQDMEIGQRSAVQYYLFSSKDSLLKPFSHELIYQIATSSSAYKEWPESMMAKLDQEFETHCAQAFVPHTGGN